MVDRVIVFVDYQNAHGTARRAFKAVNADPASGHVDPLRLGQLLVARRKRPSELVSVRVYRGRPSPDRQPGSAAANDRQTVAWNRSGMVEVIRRPLLYRYDWPITPASEKGIDVSLAVDLVRLGIAKVYDVAIVFSSDTDLMPAIETVVDFRLGHVEVANWSGTNRLRFPGTQLPWCHSIDERTYRTIDDNTNYTQP
jgi:uncharacterized LabA/DUF88 family protein